MSTETVFAVLLVLLGIGALGGMVVMEVSRLGLLSARRALVQKRTEALEKEAERARASAEQFNTAIERGQAQVTKLAAETQRLTALLRSMEVDRVEVVHDLGAPDGRPAPFRCVLRTAPDFARIDQRQVVFSRDIWQRKNVAHIWADAPELAHALLLRTFPARTGVLAGAIERMTAERTTDRTPPRPAAEPDFAAEPAEPENDFTPDTALVAA